jgi:hypothetical protein
MIYYLLTLEGFGLIGYELNIFYKKVYYVAVASYQWLRLLTRLRQA